MRMVDLFNVYEFTFKVPAFNLLPSFHVIFSLTINQVNQVKTNVQIYIEEIIFWE